MKMQITAVTLLCFVLLSAAAYADEESDAVDNDTLHQALIMGTSHGAQVRLLQLEKSIERNILFGEKVVEFIDDNYSSYNTSAMESLIDELKELKDEVASVNVSAMNTTETVRQFVDLEGDARNVSMEFRQLVHEFFNESGADPAELRAWIGGKIADDLKEFRDEIRDAIRNHNAQIVRIKLQDMGNRSLELFYKVKSGNMTPEQANDALKNMLRGMDQGKRKQAAMQLARNSASHSVKAREAIQKAKDNYTERLRERLEDRLGHMEKKSEMLRQRIERVKWAWNRTGSLDDSGPGLPPSPPEYTGHAVKGGKWK